MPAITCLTLTSLCFFQHQVFFPTLTIWRFRTTRHLDQVLTPRAIVGNTSLGILVRNRKQRHSDTLVYFFLSDGNQTLTRPITDNVPARQRSTIDLENAMLAMHTGAVRRQHATTSSAATRIIKKRKPASFFLDSEMGPSATSSGPIQPESQELDVIAKLRMGEGVSPYELLGLIEQCGICKLFFTGGVLRRHIFVCSSSET